MEENRAYALGFMVFFVEDEHQEHLRADLTKIRT